LVAATLTPAGAVPRWPNPSPWPVLLGLHLCRVDPPGHCVRRECPAGPERLWPAVDRSVPHEVLLLWPAHDRSAGEAGVGDEATTGERRTAAV